MSGGDYDIPKRKIPRMQTLQRGSEDMRENILHLILYLLSAWFIFIVRRHEQADKETFLDWLVMYCPIVNTIIVFVYIFFVVIGKIKLPERT